MVGDFDVAVSFVSWIVIMSALVSFISCCNSWILLLMPFMLIWMMISSVSLFILLECEVEVGET